ncbi:MULTISPECIES: hypothetical protein [unclassified Gordonia (in: high G+C Gram-positive bacteria)]|nr:MULTISPECIES: hypothetical protein [unclassified Gordonia (in: high G+C Gram-positive bacteria)]MCR8895458.1 hypothetical protein [Gordonia sp. GONU]
MESDDEGDLIARVREHTETAHDYVIPSEHVLLAMNRDDEFH